MITEQVGADLSDPVQLCAGRDNVAQQRFCALNIDGEIVIDKKYGNLSEFFAGSCFQQQQFVHDAFVGAKADGVAEKSSDRAELATIGTTAPRLHRYDAEGSPALAVFLQPAVKKLGDKVKLLQIKGVPGNDGILLERGLEFFSCGIDWRIDVF